MSNNLLSVSVVIPTYNRLARLKMVLAAFELQTYPLDSFEVIVVSDGSMDGTDQFLQSWQTQLNLLAIEQENQGAAAARNLGIAKAQGELILFVDDDVLPTPELIAKHVNAHIKNAGPVVVIGTMLTPQDFTLDPWTRWMQDRLAEQYQDMITGKWDPTARQFYTGNASVAREYLVAYGGFDAAFKRAEDVELAYRLADHGIRFIFELEAVGYHYEQRSFDSWIKIPYAYGRNDILMARQKNQTWLLETLFQEYSQRHALIQVMTRLCLDRSFFEKMVIGFLHRLVLLADIVRLHALSRVACSIMFNLRYYQGAADELGGRQCFFDEATEYRNSR